MMVLEVRVAIKRRVLPVVLYLAFLAQASAQSGLSVSKTCDPNPIASGSIRTCTFVVTNLDPVNPATGLVVTNTVPCPDPPTCTGGTTSAPLPCAGGTNATTLAPAGSGTADHCSGSVDETAPACSGTITPVQDMIHATATEGPNGTQEGLGTNHFNVLACTPTPTNTPTRTPTGLATNPPTNTPTKTPTPTTPTTPTTPANTPTNPPTTPTNTPTGPQVSATPTLVPRMPIVYVTRRPH
jgi:hypothetical protein